MKRLSALLGGLLVSTSLGHAQPLPPPSNTPAPAYTFGSSWKPTDSSGAGLTFNNVAANFVVIGNFVFAYATLNYPSTADGNNAQIGGLPLVSLSSVDYAAVCSVTIGGAGGAGNAAAFSQVGNVLYTYYGATATKSAGIISLISGGRALLTNASLSTVPVAVTCIYPAS
jgi:hypothetical protein